MKLYRRKYYTVEAIQYNGDNYDSIIWWAFDHGLIDLIRYKYNTLFIVTDLDYDITVFPGDYIYLEEGCLDVAPEEWFEDNFAEIGQ